MLGTLIFMIILVQWNQTDVQVQMTEMLNKAYEEGNNTRN